MASYTSARLQSNLGAASSAQTWRIGNGTYTTTSGITDNASHKNITSPSVSYSGGSSSSVSDLDNYMAQALGVSRENSAFNAAEAQKQRDWSSREAEIAREFNAAEAAKNRDWQERMSNTAHQREVADMMAAGLNPVLSAMGGNGASVTSGATASGSVPSGSKANADTSGSAAMASILGTILTAQTRLQEMTINAQTQQAVADKYTAATKLASLISADASKYGANLSSAASIYGSDVHAAATRYSAEQALKAALGSAGIHANASMYASDNALAAALAQAAATRYSADTHASATKYASDNSYNASIYGSKKSAQASMYGADKSYDASHYRTNADFIKDVIGDLLGVYSSGRSAGINGLMKLLPLL